MLGKLLRFVEDIDSPAPQTCRSKRFLLLANAPMYWLVMILCQFRSASSYAAPVVKDPNYLTAGVCRQCHQDAYRTWEQSHHAWALKKPDPQSVLGDFSGKEFAHDDVRMRFFKRDEKYFVETIEDQKKSEHEISYTVGVAPLQQYLVELEKGKLQALDVAWDTKKKNWFHLYPGQSEKPGDGFHWSGPYKNWNGRCAECHQTNYVKGHDPKQRSYRSTWSEFNVACESCHGPGEAHVGWAKDPQSFARVDWKGVDEKGLAQTFLKKDSEKEIQLCAHCHSRRRALGARSPPAGAKFSDHYQLALLRDRLYHPDGQIDEEVYVYGSFLQSKMYARGVRCTNCHNAHSGRLVAEGNGVCTQCHGPAGNKAFLSLKKKAYDDPAHHHHQEGSPGALCVSCHMPEKTFMQVDPRRDHSFRVPRPDLSAKIGTPNACTQCHSEKSAKWADDAVRNWFPQGRSGTRHFGEILHSGRQKLGATTSKQLIELSLDKEQPGIVRASALDLLRGSFSPELSGRVASLLMDKNDLVRRAAVQLFETAPGALKKTLLGPLLSDSAKAVRVETGRLFVGLTPTGLSKGERRHARRAIREFEESIAANADFPETQMQIAGLAMTLKKFGVAKQALRAALELDPQLADAWIGLARIQLALDKPLDALKTLEEAKEKAPKVGVIYVQLGAVLTTLKKSKRAIEALAKGMKISGPSPEALELLVLNHFAENEIDVARSFARDLGSQFPGYRPNPLVRQLQQSPSNGNPP